MSNCFLQLGAHLNPMVSLFIVQETRNKLCCNSSNAITNIVDSLSSRITSGTFAIISGAVHMDGQPECLRSFTDSRPSLKNLNHSDVLAWLKACTPKVSFSIRWVSTPVLLSMKQTLTLILPRSRMGTLRF